MLQRIAKRRPGQAGQALIEYALISAAMVLCFAVAYDLGLSDGWAQSLDSARDGYYTTVDLNGHCPPPTDNHDCADSVVSGLDTVRDQLELH